jgi:Tfp pilus assembly protein PilX
MGKNKDDFTIIQNESGSILLTTLLIMLLLTVIGIGSITTSSTDLQISHNYRVYKENLILADAAVNEASTLILVGEADNTKTWVNNITDLFNEDNKYLKKGASYDNATTPVLNQIEVDKVIEDWDTFKDGDSSNNIASINPKELNSDSSVEYVVYRNPNSTNNQMVVISRARKNGGDVVLEVAISNN